MRLIKTRRDYIFQTTSNNTAARTWSKPFNLQDQMDGPGTLMSVYVLTCKRQFIYVNC